MPSWPCTFSAVTDPRSCTGSPAPAWTGTLDPHSSRVYRAACRARSSGTFPATTVIASTLIDGSVRARTSATASSEAVSVSMTNRRGMRNLSRGSAQGGAGVDDELDAGHVAGLVGAEPADGAGDVARCHPVDAHGQLEGAADPRRRRLPVLRGRVLGHVGPGAAGVHDVDPDAVAGELEGQALGQADEAGLGRRVVADGRQRFHRR